MAPTSDYVECGACGEQDLLRLEQWSRAGASLPGYEVVVKHKTPPKVKEEVTVRGSPAAKTPHAVCGDVSVIPAAEHG